MIWRALKLLVLRPTTAFLIYSKVILFHSIIFVVTPSDLLLVYKGSIH